MTDATNRYLIEENMMGWIIESNHLVDALLRESDRAEIIDIMQRRYDAAYQTVLALRQRMDAMEDEIRASARDATQPAQPAPVSEIASEAGKYRVLTKGCLQQYDQWLGVRGWVEVDYWWWGAQVPHDWHCRRPIAKEPA